MFNHLDKYWEAGNSSYQLIEKCENMLVNGEETYFDIIEFEYLIDYYIYKIKHESANKLVNLSLKQHPSSISLQLKKAHLLINCNKANEALTLLQQWESSHSSQTDFNLLKGNAYLTQGKFLEAEKYFRIAIKSEIENKVKILYDIADTYINLEYYNFAINYLKQALTIHKNNLYIINSLGFCYEKIKDFPTSIYYYNLYLDISPYSFNIWYRLGIIYSENHQLDLACGALDFAMAIDPYHTKVFHLKANLLMLDDKFEEAIEYLTELLKIDKKEILYINCQIAQCYEKIDEPEKEKNYYFKTLKLNPSYKTALCGLGNYYFKKRNFKNAVKYWENIISDDIEVKYKLMYAISNDKLHNDLEAKKIFDEILLQEKKIYTVWIAYADFHIYRRNFHDAINVLGNTLKHIDQNSGILYRLAVCYFSLNDYKNGNIFFNKGFEMKDNYGSLEDIIGLLPATLREEKIKNLFNFHS